MRFFANRISSSRETMCLANCGVVGSVASVASRVLMCALSTDLSCWAGLSSERESTDTSLSMAVNGEVTCESCCLVCIPGVAWTRGGRREVLDDDWAGGFVFHAHKPWLLAVLSRAHRRQRRRLHPPFICRPLSRLSLETAERSAADERDGLWDCCRCSYQANQDRRQHMVMKKTMSQLERKIDVRPDSTRGFSAQQWMPHSIECILPYAGKQPKNASQRLEPKWQREN